MTPKTITEKLTVWLQLLRVPNLFTVPGDPLAGFCLAAASGGDGFSNSFSSLFAVLLVSLLAYGSGLLQNDYFDLEEDRRERPSRPLPSNRVKPVTVILAAAFLTGAALVIAFFLGTATGVVALFLSLSITVYDFRGKRIPIAGPILMGLCRGLSFLLGASLKGWPGIFSPAVVVSALFLIVYIAVVTYIAAHETKGYRSGPIRWFPGLTLVVWFSCLYFLIRPGVFYALPVSIVMTLLAVAWTLFCGNLLGPDTPPAVVQQTIGRFLRCLLLIQAAMAAFAGYPGIIMVLLLLAAWPVSQKLAKRFYAS